MDRCVIKNKRVRDYLYLLGFNYTTAKDMIDKDKDVYIFKQSDKLSECILFYKEVKSHRIKNENK